jgi:hypothetical protein
LNTYKQANHLTALELLVATLAVNRTLKSLKRRRNVRAIIGILAYLHRNKVIASLGGRKKASTVREGAGSGVQSELDSDLAAHALA